MNNGIVSAFVISVFFSGLAHAELVTDLLKSDVLCENSSKSITISKDIKSAEVVSSDVSITRKVNYRYNTGSNGQTLVVTIQGLDNFNQSTVVTDIFALDKGVGVIGYRDEQTGFGVTILERFVCHYTP